MARAKAALEDAARVREKNVELEKEAARARRENAQLKKQQAVTEARVLQSAHDGASALARSAKA